MTRDEWKAHIGVGEPQPRDSVVTDGTRTRTTVVPHVDDGRPAGTQTEHRSGRQDANVFAPPYRLEQK